MISYRELLINDIHHIEDIDRSETITYIYKLKGGELQELQASHECPSWDKEAIIELKERLLYELVSGGKAIGAFEADRMVGFGVLAHPFRGAEQNQLQIDLMYVSKAFRRMGIGTEILNQLSDEARKRGAAYLYISSTETQSAVFFYKSNGSQITNEVDPELFEKEPLDIHMLKKL
ncbi:ribosomal protein S18 acetylase RimI-like enzyme [Paenibacillus castaneae]|uniref:GNAT family N-acetyltransferase n=1 Tax=Paenibacillus castaneae TaxID=474957 RepID=UPI000C9C5CDF|nr:GNAT family N-acetyltransferase [Paenibacillus castaneae]NIK75526.1 ribosomal protein S18 acetylase RimI-like enzyme [Paenibacillus castaneae]